MNKIIFFLLTSVFLVSCSSSDDRAVLPKKEERLQLDIKDVTIVEKESALFTILNENKQTVDAILYVDNEPMGNPIQFNKVGVYQVVAKKEGYLDSNVIEVNVVKKRRKNNLKLNKRPFEIESVSLSIEQVNFVDYSIPREYVVDKVLNLSNIGTVNIYHFDIRIKGNKVFERIDVRYLVPNTTVVMVGGNIVDHGQRIFPFEVEKVLYYDSWIVLDHYNAGRDYNTANATLEMDDFVINNKGIGVGPIGVDFEGGFGIVYKDGDTVIEVEYHGKIKFTELLKESF